METQEIEQLVDQFRSKLSAFASAQPAVEAVAESAVAVAEPAAAVTPPAAGPCLDRIVQELLLSFIKEIPVCEEGKGGEG